jgi:hypothetical protein
MEIKNLVQRFVYRIEPNPAGGFIARPADPTIPPLEASTREELQQKIQAKAIAALGEAFPGLKIPLRDKRLNFELHVDHTPGSGFRVHSDEPGTPTIDPAIHEKIDHFAEQLLDFVEKHFPHLSETIATQVKSNTIQVFTNEKITANKNSPLGIAQGSSPSLMAGTDNGLAGVWQDTAPVEPTLLNSTPLGNSPIIPESSGSGKIFRFILILLIIAALMYFFAHQR